ncbi:hypothetical protein CCP4SC76_6550001 [Gammaproteobacteria bacterium]
MNGIEAKPLKKVPETDAIFANIEEKDGKPLEEDGTTGTFVNGQVVVTVMTPDGKPRPGATVTLDGSAKRTTDANGKAMFTASKGTHTAVIEAPGMTPQSITVEAR